MFILGAKNLATLVRAPRPEVTCYSAANQGLILDVRDIKMNKPKIFFSHSSKDSDTLVRLKELFIDKTGGTIEVFLSSDGQSIPLGKNWVHRIEEALDETTLMLVFLTPNSVKSDWIYFETGYVYSKGVRVVPVGIMGVDLSHIKPPLSLLQGFNISNKDGLDNLIALANEKYSHTHKSKFTETEYRELISHGEQTEIHPLGKFLPYIDQISIEINSRDNFSYDIIECINRAKNVFNKNKVEFRDSEKKIESYGISIYTRDGQHPIPIIFQLDPFLIDRTFDLLKEVLECLLEKGITGVRFRLDFINGISCVKEQHKITAKLYGTGITFGDNEELILNNLTFYMSHLMYFPGSGRTKSGVAYLSIKPTNNELTINDIVNLLNLLFKKKVINYEDEWIEV